MLGTEYYLQSDSVHNGSGGSSVKIRRNRHYRDRDVKLPPVSRNTCRTAQGHRHMPEHFWVMKSAAVLLIPREKCRMRFSIGIFDAAALFPPYGGRSVFVFINFRGQA